MEAVLFIIVVTVLCLCLGVGAAYIVFGILCLLALGVILMFILFAYSLICMLFSQKTKAEFVRIDKNGKINSAFYLIDGVEYPCMFPSEAFLKKRIYSDDKEYAVRLNRRKKCVFDRFAAATCITGFLFSLLFAGAAVIFMIFIFSAGTKGV